MNTSALRNGPGKVLLLKAMVSQKGRSRLKDKGDGNRVPPSKVRLLVKQRDRRRYSEASTLEER